MKCSTWHVIRIADVFQGYNMLETSCRANFSILTAQCIAVNCWSITFSSCKKSVNDQGLGWRWLKLVTMASLACGIVSARDPGLQPTCLYNDSLDHNHSHVGHIQGPFNVCGFALCITLLFYSFCITPVTTSIRLHGYARSSKLVNCPNRGSPCWRWRAGCCSVCGSDAMTERPPHDHGPRWHEAEGRLCRQLGAWAQSQEGGRKRARERKSRLRGRGKKNKISVSHHILFSQ